MKASRLEKRIATAFRLAANVRLVRWWLDEDAANGPEFSSFAVLATLIVFALMSVEVLRHGHTRTAGTALILQLAAVVAGAPVVIGRLLPKGEISFSGRARIRAANLLRWPLRHRRLTRSVATSLFCVGVFLAVAAKETHAASLLFLIAFLLFAHAWVGFFLPRRFTARVDPDSGNVTGYVSMGAHPHAQWITAAITALLFASAYLIQFLALYSIPPW